MSGGGLDPLAGRATISIGNVPTMAFSFHIPPAYPGTQWLLLFEMLHGSEQHDEWDGADRPYFSDHPMKRLQVDAGEVAVPELPSA